MESACNSREKRLALPADMYQSNKSLLVIQEATKNDRSTIPKKLLEYIVELQQMDETEEINSPSASAAKDEERAQEKVQRWCTAREQSWWILTQLQNIFLTKQRWRMIKVNFILHALLWRGSRVFIEEFHNRLTNKELCFFDFTMVLSWRQAKQTNPTGAPVPSVFDKDTEKRPAQKQKDEDAADPASHSPDLATDVRADKTYEVADILMAQFNAPDSLSEEESHFFKSWKKNAIKRECESTEELLKSALLEDHIANHMAYLESLTNFRFDYPQVSLMEIMVHDINIHGKEEKQAMTLAQMESLLTSALELIKSTVFKAVESPVCAVSSMIILFRYYNSHVLYKIASQVLAGVVHLLVRAFLDALADVDRNGMEGGPDVVANSLPSLNLSTSDVHQPTRLSMEIYSLLAPRQKMTFIAREWYTTLYQFNRTATFYLAQCAEVQRMIDMPYMDPDWLHVLPQESFEMMKTYGSLHPSRNVCAWCGSEADTPACHPEGEHHVPPCAVHLVSAWRQQVKNVRSLFLENGKPRNAPQVLSPLEAAVMEVEQGLSNMVATPTSAAGMTPSLPTSITNSIATTFLIRRTGADKPNASSKAKPVDVEVMYMDQLMGSTTDSIEAMLHDDDVVVVCPDDFSATDRLKLADRFVVLKERPLGEGSYGKVYRAWDELLGSYLAAKEVPLDSSKGTLTGAVREALHEYTILTQLHHPHIVAVRAFMVTGSVGTIFMEWMPSGSLQEVLRSNPRGCLREPVVARFMRDALRGLEYLHSRDIMHRDVKPANMLLGTDGSVKLTDFGNSFVMAEGGHTIENNTITGTAPYIAPECAQGTYSPAGDVWSLGCSAVELLSGLVPWSDPVTGSRPETIPLIFRIGMLDDKTRTDRPHTLMWDNMVKKAGKEGLSPELRSFLDAIFVVDRHARPTATQLLQHPFILKYDTIH